MRTSAALLVLTCLALAASPDRGAAQQAQCEPGLAEEWVDPNGGDGTNGYCNHGCGEPRVWGGVEFLLGFRKSRQVPPLVTTSLPGTTQSDAGVLGLSSTTILFGGDGLEDNPQPGVRGEVGVWLDRAARIGIGGAFTGLQEDSVRFSATSDGSSILARPFYNTLLDQQASQLVAFPAIVRGSVNVESVNGVYTAEAFLRTRLAEVPVQHPVLFLTDAMGIMAARVRSLFYLPGTQAVCIHEYNTPVGGPMTRFDLITGYEFSRIDDSLSITNNLVSLDPSFLGQIGTTLDAFDHFDARNDFHGATIGLKTISHQGRWSLSMLGKAALGNMHQAVSVDGQTVITVPGGPSVLTPGGLLTQLSNMGTFERDRFAVIPEAQIMITYDITPRLNVGVGYNFIYWNRVAFAGDQVDTQVDVTQTLSDPTFSFREGDFFVHAATVVLQLNH